MRKIINKDIETGTEYVLPDYMGDVKKVLFTSAKVIPSASFLNGAEAEFSGVVEYELCYSDSEGVFTKASTTSDYDFRVAVNEESCTGAHSDVKVQSYSVRLTGPRKFTAKAVLATESSVSEKSDYTPKGSVFDGSCKYESVSRVLKEEALLHGVSAEREYAEELLSLEETEKDAVEILSASGSVRVTEAEAVDNGVRVKGEMIITAIISTENQPPFAIKKIIPFEETVGIEGVNQSMQSLADGYLTSVTASAVEAGEATSVTASVILELNASALCNTEAEILTDAYLESRDTVCEYENRAYTEFLSATQTNEIIALEASRNELGAENISYPLAAKSELRSVSKKPARGGLEISGEALVSFVSCEVDENGNAVYTPLKFTAPFAMFVNLNCQIPENASVDCKVVPTDTDITVDAENIYSKTSVSVYLRAYTEKSEKCLKSCEITGDNEYTHTSSKITVYYPEENESLFSVAKDFHTTSARIASDNNLTVETMKSDDKETLKGVTRLIIR